MLHFIYPYYVFFYFFMLHFAFLISQWLCFFYVVIILKIKLLHTHTHTHIHTHTHTIRRRILYLNKNWCFSDVLGIHDEYTEVITP